MSDITAPSPVLTASVSGTQTSADTQGDFSASNEVKGDAVREQSTNANNSLNANDTKNYYSGSSGGAPTNMEGNMALGDNKDYWWNTMADDVAFAQYQTDVNNAVMNSLSSRTNIEKNAAQAMENFFTEQYASNQQVDKAGWTGGYVLDSERQMSYLKATISADMYNQMELQKVGYDSQLAAARFAYEANEKTLAHEYYQSAVNNAIQEANVTGYYMPPEAKENLNQISMAEKMLKDPNATAQDKAKAQGVISAGNAWFTNQGISKQGQKTLALLQHEEQERANKENERLQQLEIDSANLRHAEEMKLGREQIAAQEKMNQANIASQEKMNSANIASQEKMNAANIASNEKMNSDNLAAQRALANASSSGGGSGGGGNTQTKTEDIKVQDEKTNEKNGIIKLKGEELRVTANYPGAVYKKFDGKQELYFDKNGKQISYKSTNPAANSTVKAANDGRTTLTKTQLASVSKSYPGAVTMQKLPSGSVYYYDAKGNRVPYGGIKTTTKKGTQTNSTIKANPISGQIK